MDNQNPVTKYIGIAVLVIILGVFLTNTFKSEQTKEKPAVASADLAKRVDAELKKAYLVEEYSELKGQTPELPASNITSIKDGKNGEVIVATDGELSPMEEIEFARSIMSSIGLEVTDLAKVTIDDGDTPKGSAVRNDIPMLRK